MSAKWGLRYRAHDAMVSRFGKFLWQKYNFSCKDLIFDQKFFDDAIQYYSSSSGSVVPANDSRYLTSFAREVRRLEEDVSPRLRSTYNPSSEDGINV